jgi:hypothetical protein
MIRKSILFCLLLLIAYSLLLTWRPGLSASQHVWQSNMIKAEKYLDDDGRPVKDAIIGSSVSERLIMDSIPDCDNLAFSGLSVLDGLDLVRHKNKLPSVVYIETNFPLRPKTPLFSTTLFSPISVVFRKHVVFLRSDKQPLALIGQAVGELVERVDLGLLRRLEVLAGTRIGSAARLTDVPFDQMLSLEVKDYSEKPDPKLLDEQFQLLRNEVSYLVSRGVRIVFFEMPVNSQLTGLPKAQIIRDSFYSVFPRQQYRYMDMPDPAAYKTADGIHLSRKEAIQYTRFFNEQAKKLTNR